MRKPEARVRNGAIVIDGQQISIPDMSINHQLGAGASGAVFDAVDEILGRTVAVKLWYKQQLHSNRALEESRRLAGLSHPLLATLYSIGRAKGYVYTIMEKISGVSLREHLRAKTLTPTDKYQIGVMILTGLEFLYGRKILHGDPHIGNFLIFEDKLGSCSNYRPHLYADVRTNDLGIKIIDIGSSIIKRNRKNLESREIDTLFETFDKLLESIPVKDFMKRSHISTASQAATTLKLILELYKHVHFRFERPESYMGIDDLLLEEISRSPFIDLPNLRCALSGCFETDQTDLAEMDIELLYYLIDTRIRRPFLSWPCLFNDEEFEEIDIEFEKYQKETLLK